VHAATLPSAMEDFGDGALDPFVRVRDHKFDPAQAAPRERAQLRGPEGLGLGRAKFHVENLAASVAPRRRRPWHAQTPFTQEPGDLH
jgi:hypothetical protein